MTRGGVTSPGCPSGPKGLSWIRGPSRRPHWALQILLDLLGRAELGVLLCPAQCKWGTQ